VCIGMWLKGAGGVAIVVHYLDWLAVKHVNESLELVCTALDCPSEATFTWKSLGDISVGGVMKSNQTTSHKMYSHIRTEHGKTVVCQVDCGGLKEQRTTIIEVYSFPSDPVISRTNNLTLMCTFPSVYTSEFFNLQWVLGDNVLKDEEITFDAYKGVQNVSSEYTMSDKYLGKNITCRGVLNLRGRPEGQKVRSFTAHNTTVKVGERLELRCDADGQSDLTWRKLGKSEVLSRGKVTVIENVTWSDAGMYECEASTKLLSLQAKVGVTVQGPPNLPKFRLSSAGNPRAGDYVTITCDSDSVLPVELTISGASLNQVEKHSSSISINIPSIQLKDSGLYFCDAKNELGSKRSSINITYLHCVCPTPPKVTLSWNMNSTVLVYPSAQVMEAQNITVHCSTVSFPPASIILMREADGFQEFRSTNGTFHLFNLKSEDMGTYIVNFTNELGYEVQTFELIKAPPRNSTVLVYPSAQVMEAQNITVHCSTVSFPPASIILMREADGFQEFRSTNGTFHLFNLKSEDMGTYIVNFTNELGYEVQTFELIKGK
uniref:Ig-like domain-containing protein n=1 Tax=Pygocentrus nattereri TaxID=42514 RepID=A0A3B4DA34_PYGNA